MGPVNQLKKMFAATRVVATLMIFVAFGLTLYAGLVVSTKNCFLSLYSTLEHDLTYLSIFYLET